MNKWRNPVEILTEELTIKALEKRHLDLISGLEIDLIEQAIKESNLSREDYYSVYGKFENSWNRRNPHVSVRDEIEFGYNILKQELLSAVQDAEPIIFKIRFLASRRFVYESDLNLYLENDLKFMAAETSVSLPFEKHDSECQFRLFLSASKAALYLIEEYGRIGLAKPALEIVMFSSTGLELKYWPVHEKSLNCS